MTVVDASATGGAMEGERKPYILLDMRDEGAYRAFHIRNGARAAWP